MTQQHPITPPPELVSQWCNDCGHWTDFENVLAIRAAQWGSDQELEACCKWLVKQGWFSADEHEAIEELRASRRPKQSSLKEQALRGLDGLAARLEEAKLPADLAVLYRALEQLPE